LEKVFPHYRSSTHIFTGKHAAQAQERLQFDIVAGEEKGRPDQALSVQQYLVWAVPYSGMVRTK
jgi:hypothetical protein